METKDLEERLEAVDFSAHSAVKDSLKAKLLFMQKRNSMMTRHMPRLISDDDLDMVVAAGISGNAPAMKTFDFTEMAERSKKQWE